MTLTTLILGAGLGKEYGFPDGPELRKLLIHELPDHENDLKNICLYSPAQTVDEIAARYPLHANTIRRLTVKILRERENEQELFQNEKPNTYKFMLWQIANAKANGHQVEIITFNYDRSLHYLLHKVNSVEIPDRRIETKTIQHVYGRLAPLWFEDQNQRPTTYHEYAKYPDTPQDYNPEYWQNTCIDELNRASNLFFIGEEKAPKPTQLKTTLENSDQIFFLGVGYHKANMDILGLDFTKRHPKKLIVGTGLNLDGNYIQSLKEEYSAIDHIETCDAHSFLKTKFKIDEVAKNFSKKM